MVPSPFKFFEIRFHTERRLQRAAPYCSYLLSGCFGVLRGGASGISLEGGLSG
jgi:hypothetical protein